MIIHKSSSCHYCKVDLVCHSNSTSQSVGYYMFPNNARRYSESSYYYYNVFREGYSGIRIRNYAHYQPNIYGIFTCEIPDSEGNTLETSIGIYSSMPSEFIYNGNCTANKKKKNPGFKCRLLMQVMLGHPCYPKALPCLCDMGDIALCYSKVYCITY